jgi:hypothetical protein
MAQNTVYQWPVQNLQAVCKTQDADAGDNLSIKRNVMAVSGVAQISFIRSGFSRSVSISSTDDLSGATFTVTGIQNGAGIIKNNITGPNNNTIYTDEIFDAITSVTVDSNVTHVQVGTGDTGFSTFNKCGSHIFQDLISGSTNGSYALSVIP